MGKDPTGSRPTGRIPSGGGNKWDRDPHGGTDAGGESHTKTPTGSRPVPGIPRHTPPHPTVPGAVKAPIDHTTMPAPNKKRLTGAPKNEGGGSY